MTIASRTPEGQPFRCPVCGEDTDIEPALAGEACCPACGELLWWFRDRVDARLKLEDSLEDANLDSLELVELVMQLEELGINLSKAAAAEIETIEDLIRTLRRLRRRKHDK